MQQSRRHDPYPWTWEIPLGVTVAVLLVVVFAAHAGRAVANMWAGHPWRFPPRTELFSSLPGLVRGDAMAGLQAMPGQGPAAAAEPLWMWMGLVEGAALALVVFLAVRGLRRWGPGRVKGMASPADVERMLGRSRLRANRAVVRPDLYGQRGQVGQRDRTLRAGVDR